MISRQANKHRQMEKYNALAHQASKQPKRKQINKDATKQTNTKRVKSTDPVVHSNFDIPWSTRCQSFGYLLKLTSGN